MLPAIASELRLAVAGPAVAKAQALAIIAGVTLPRLIEILEDECVGILNQLCDLGSGNLRDLIEDIEGLDAQARQEALGRVALLRRQILKSGAGHDENCQIEALLRLVEPNRWSVQPDRWLN